MKVLSLSFQAGFAGEFVLLYIDIAVAIQFILLLGAL